MIYKADMHIHSCLSPCGDLEMSPRSIARQASETGLGIIALTDHNSALNCPAFEKACKDAGVFPLFGLEITSREEAHVLCLFETPEHALEMGTNIYPLLPNIPNDPDKFGDQVYVDHEDTILGEVEKHLTGSAVDLSIDEIGNMTRSMGGLFIPAHVDKPVFSLTSQLGFIPPDDYSALEVVFYPPECDTGNYPLVRSSDAHYLHDIGKRVIKLDLETLTFDEIKKAITENRIEL